MVFIVHHNGQDILENIFKIRSSASFEGASKKIFELQFQNNAVYRRYAQLLKFNPSLIRHVSEIPFLPIEFFKTHEVVTASGALHQQPVIFTSSGTTGAVRSRHFVTDVLIYEASFKNGFDHFYGNVEEYCILALLPSYREQENSSLVYMVDDLVRRTKNPDSGFYLNNTGKLIKKINFLESKQQKTILIGVTYALLDLVEKHKFNLQHTIVMETGGMKGKRKEMVREELHKVLCEGFGVNEIHSEYGMTELLSQSYSKGNGIFRCPPWMKIFIRDVNDPFNILEPGKTGGINVIDLANLNSCSFIATQDLGKVHEDGSFEVLGRLHHSDLRGCNLMAE